MPLLARTMGPMGVPCEPRVGRRRAAVLDGRTRGFTLLEALVAMALMTIIILMVANMFRIVSDTWEIGTRQAELNTGGRAAVDLMASELSAAVAGRLDNGVVLPFYLTGGERLEFLAVNETPNGVSRTLRGVYFKYESADNAVSYWRETTTDNILSCYRDPPWTPSWGSSDILVEYVRTARFTAYPSWADLAAGSGVTAYDSTAYTNRLPVCLDIALELLSREDWARAAQLGGAAQTEFIAEHARYYATRVFFPKRDYYENM